jgi:hypothetical protein
VRWAWGFKDGMPCSNRDLYGTARETALEVAETAAGAGTARTGSGDFEPENISASATVTPAIASPAKTNQVIRREPSGARGWWDMGVDMGPPDAADAVRPRRWNLD